MQPTYRIIMDGVDTIRQHFVEPFPLHGERVPVQPQDVIRVDFSNGRFNPIIKRRKPDMLRIAGLVDRVVAGNPRIALVSSCDLLPQPDGSILVVLKVPERRVRGRVVCVPVGVLTAGGRVHVEDGVYVVFGTLSETSISQSFPRTHLSFPLKYVLRVTCCGVNSPSQ